ncbi:MAG: twin-arginine translocation signal domain-containing protein [Thermoguttaceae bacterium]|nr:twin-arginine translocation signal domain-containing protein [Thermoguttaceae bacterium]
MFIFPTTRRTFLGLSAAAACARLTSPTRPKGGRRPHGSVSLKCRSHSSRSRFPGRRA